MKSKLHLQGFNRKGADNMKKPSFIKVVKKENKRGNAKRRIAAGSAIVLAAAVSLASMNLTVTAGSKADGAESEEETKMPEAMDPAADELAKQLTGQIGVSESEADKEETVYVITDASGNVTSTIVSDWLKNEEGNKTVLDATSLSDVTNVKGDEGYKENGDGTIVWDAEGNDIYYQGRTKQQSPIDVKISYYLDGKKIAPGDLAGKSGKVKIRLDYTNLSDATIEIKGKEEQAKIPFTVISGMVLPLEHFSNVSVKNGRVISDGNRNIVVGVAMPGLKETIDPEGKLAKEGSFEIPDYVEVEADAKDFALDMTMSVALSDVLGQFDMGSSLDADGIQNSLNQLTDATGQLLDGSIALKDGTGRLKDGGNQLKNGIGVLQGGIGEYTNGVGQLSTGLGQLAAGSGQLSNGAAAVSAGVSVLAGKLNGMSDKLAVAIDEQKKNEASLKPVVEADKASVTGEITDYATNVATASATAAAPVAAKVGAQAVGNAVSAAANNPDLTNAVNAAVTQAAQSYAASYGAQNAPGVAGAAAGTVAGAAATAAATASGAIGKDGNILAANVEAYTNAVTNAVANAVASAVAQAVISDYTGGLAATVAQTAGSTMQGGISGGLTEEQITAAVTAAMSSPETQAAIANAAGAAAQSVSTEGVSNSISKLGSDAGSLGGAVGAETALGSIRANMDMSQLSALVQGAADVAGGAAKLNDGIGSANAGAAKLAGASGDLNNGTAKLASGADQLADGINQLDEGAEKLSEGMMQFDEEGIQKISDALGDEAVEIIDRIKAVKELGSGYETFTGLADGQSGTVKFIIRTGSVK